MSLPSEKRTGLFCSTKRSMRGSGFYEDLQQVPPDMVAPAGQQVSEGLGRGIGAPGGEGTVVGGDPCRAAGYGRRAAEL